MLTGTELQAHYCRPLITYAVLQTLDYRNRVKGTRLQAEDYKHRITGT